MEFIKFNKTLCGVELLLNVIDCSDSNGSHTLHTDLRATDFFQIVYIKKGKGFLVLNGETHAIASNSMWFISKNQPYQWVLDDNANYEVRVLVFQDEFLNEFFADQYFTFRLLYFYQNKFPLQLNCKTSLFEDQFERLSEIQKELRHPKSDSAHLIRSILYYLLIQTNRMFAEQNHIDFAIALDNVAYAFRKLVEERIFEWQRIEDYTSHLGISRVTLNKAVKAQFHVTARDFIKDKLLFEVKKLLMHSTKTISEIATELHFSEPNHLTRLFKNKEGITPVEFRTAYQNGRL